MATTTGTGRGAVTDHHTGWDCPNGASLLAGITGPGRGTLPAYYGCIYVCPDHQAQAEARITAAGHQPDTRPAPPSHRWDPWPCGHITTHGANGPQLANALTTPASPATTDPVTTQPDRTPIPQGLLDQQRQINDLTAEVNELRAQVAAYPPARLAAILHLTGGRPGYHTLTVKQILTAGTDNAGSTPDTPAPTTQRLDTAAAARVHYTDPRIRQLAEARWRLATGGTRTDWLALGKDNPEALIADARDWARAAAAAGILPPPQRDTYMDQLYAELKASRPDPKDR